MVRVAVSHLERYGFDACRISEQEACGVVELFQYQILKRALVPEFPKKAAHIGWAQVHLARDISQVF